MTRGAAELPGAELVEKGLADLRDGRETVESLLVSIGAPRLRWLGLELPPPEALPARPEHRLYDLLCAQGRRDAHSAYNALKRRLVSYEHALESRRQRFA